MKIFLVSADPGIDPEGTKGASLHLRSLLRAWKNDGHGVHGFTRRGHGSTDWSALAGADQLVRAAEIGGCPDVVYERLSIGHADGLEAARRLGRPFVLEVNAPLVQETERHRPDRLIREAAAIESRLLREADAVFVVSEPLRTWVAGIRGTSDSVFVARNGFDPERFRVAANPAEPTSQTMVFLGHPKPWHGAGRLPHLLRLLESWGILAKPRICGGGPGPDEDVPRAERLGISPRFEVTGPLGELAAAAALADAAFLIAPYHAQEPFYFCPLKVIEGMAMGLPVLSTDQGDLRDILGDTGLLVPPADDEALAAQAARLLLQPSLRGQLGAAARARALARFTWQQTAGFVVSRCEGLTARSTS